MSDVICKRCFRVFVASKESLAILRMAGKVCERIGVPPLEPDGLLVCPKCTWSKTISGTSPESGSTGGQRG